MVGPYRQELGSNGFDGVLTDLKLRWAGDPNFSLLKLSGDTRLRGRATRLEEKAGIDPENAE